MRIKFIATTFSLSTCILIFSGCKPPVPLQGFTVETDACQPDNSVFPPICLAASIPQPIPNVMIGGRWEGSMTGAQGTVQDFGVDLPQPSYSVITGQNGTVFISGAEAPAYWQLNAYMPFFCGNLSYKGLVTVDDTNYFNYGTDSIPINNLALQALDCVQTATFKTASTRFAILGSFPGSLTLGSVTPFTTVYGMPLLYVYDGTRTVVATETATSVASDGSTATFPFPSSLAENGYSLAVLNATNSSPSYTAAGVNLLSIAASTTYTGSPFGVSVGSQTWKEITRTGCSRPVTTTTTYQVSVPVVSLITSNQLNIDGTSIDAGTGPAAVVAYPGPLTGEAVDLDDGGDDPCSVTTVTAKGMTRALVANSGDNTVSVVDIVNDYIISTTAVGDQPVAIAINSTGTTAYIANYGDDTITKLDLASGDVSTSATLPGQPTTVSVTTAGAVWTGGVGFVAELDGSSLGVIVSQSTGTKTVAGMSYSDLFGKLVATTVDYSGNITSDQIQPSSVSSNASYAPLATSNVSTTPQFTNAYTNVPYNAFSSTIGGSTALNPNQLGAPPLVVQDGWAVISATPTGFSVSDLSGGQVLFTEQTSSPVAAIAVDTNLSVAYITLPDSNQLLTVPLPGVQ